jgi:malonyl-CoA O-methyltransferase
MLNLETIQRNFSRSAATYDRWSRMQQRVGLRMLDLLDDALEPQRVLEIGCGTGTFTQALHERFPQAELMALDLSAAMIAQARVKGWGGRVRFAVADVAQPAALAEMGCFDLVIANASLHWLPDMHAGIAHLAEHLTDEGTFCFSAFGPGTYRELATVLAELEPPGPIPVSVGFPDQRTLSVWLHEAFAAVTLTTHNDVDTYDSLLTLLRKIKYSGTQGETAAGWRFTRPTIQRLEALYRERYGGIHATYEVLYGRACIRRAACNPSL